jgi:hypothetical protein
LGMTRKIEIIRHVPEAALEQLYREEKHTKIKERLHSILLLYREYQADETAEILRRGYATIRRWKDGKKKLGMLEFTDICENIQESGWRNST